MAILGVVTAGTGNKAGRIAKIINKADDYIDRSENIENATSAVRHTERVLDSASKVSGLTDDVSDIKKFAEVSSKYGRTTEQVGNSLKNRSGLFGNAPKVARESLNGAQSKNLKRFEKKLPAGSDPVVLHKADSDIVFRGEVPGKVPGSKAVYEKLVDDVGKTKSYTKTTYNPDGKIIHIKDKIDGSVITPE